MVNAVSFHLYFALQSLKITELQLHVRTELEFLRSSETEVKGTYHSSLRILRSTDAKGRKLLLLFEIFDVTLCGKVRIDIMCALQN